MKRSAAVKRKAPLARVSKTPRAALKYLCLELSRVLKMIDHGAFWMGDGESDGARMRCREWWGTCAAHNWMRTVRIAGKPENYKGPVQWAHVIGRAHEGLMCDPDNAFIACGGCHKFLDSNPHAKRHFIIDAYGADRMSRLEADSRPTAEVDLSELAARLEAECVAVGAAEHVGMARERMNRRRK